MAEVLKTAGNDAFKRGELAEALRLWRRALATLRPDEGQLAAALHNNCALVLLRLSTWKEAFAAASVALSSDPKNEKALHRRAQARIALNDIDGATEDAQAAYRLSPQDAAITALSSGLLQAQKRIKSRFNPRKSLPRARAATISNVYNFVGLGHDSFTNVFSADAESSVPALGLHEQEEMCGYLGGAVDGRHFFATINALGTDLAKSRPNGATQRIRIFLNDINPAAIVRMAVLLVALDKLAQCGDLDNAAKDPRSANRDTVSAAFLLTNLFIGGALFEEQYRAVTGILQAFVADPRKSLPKWLSLGPNDLEKITTAASGMLKSKRTWMSELPRLKAYLEHASTIGDKMQIPDAMKPRPNENVVASFFDVSLKLPDSDINERFAHLEAKNAEERRAKLTQLRNTALTLPRPALNVAEQIPSLLGDLANWMKNFRLTPPAQLRHLEAQPLFINPTLIDDAWLSRGGQLEAVPRPDVLLHITDDLPEDIRGHKLLPYSLCADVVALGFCRAALGLRRFLRGDGAPSLQVELRYGDLSTDLDELQRDGVSCDRIFANNVGDYAGLLPILVSSSRMLRQTKKAMLRTNILLAPNLWTSPEHYIYENGRLRVTDVKSLLHLQPKLTDVWKDLIFAAIEPRECNAAGTDQVYDWLAGLFLVVCRPAQRSRQLSRVISSLTMAAWMAAAEQARTRHGDGGVLKLLRDLLNNQLSTRHRYPATAPEKAPSKKRPPPETVNVRPYLAELRALTTLWLLPNFGNAVPDTELANAAIPRSGITLKVECQLPIPPEWKDDFSCGEPSNLCLGLVIFSGQNASTLASNFPKSLWNAEEGVHSFSVLHWDSAAHRVKFWLTADDLIKFHSSPGRAQLYLTDSYAPLGSSTDIRSLKADFGAQLDDLPPLIDSPRAKAAAAAVPPPAPAAATPAPAPAAAPSPASVRAVPEKAEVKKQEPPAPAPAIALPVVFPIGSAVPVASAAPLYSPNVAAVPVTAPLMPPVTAEPVPITGDEPFEPFIPQAALAPKSLAKGADAARRVEELEAQVRTLTSELEKAKQDAAAANSRASRFEAEIARLKASGKKEEKWIEDDGRKAGGRGRGRGQRRHL